MDIPIKNALDDGCGGPVYFVIGVLLGQEDLGCLRKVVEPVCQSKLVNSVPV